jgi:propanol-preferring alcohol dehydrogenase
MKAMVLDAPGRPLVERRRRRRKLRAGEVRVRVSACGVCRTDLHLVDGELPDPSCPVVPGHEIVGTVIDSAPDVALEPGLRVGIPWLGWSCGACDY